MTQSNPALLCHRGLSLAGFVRAAIIVAAWLPFLAALVYIHRYCAPIYDHWEDFEVHDEPPTLTVCVLKLSRLNAEFHCLPFVAFLLLLLVGNSVTAWAASHRNCHILHSRGIAVGVLFGLVAFGVCIAAVIVPLYGKSTT
jgi:hypothetical protein